MSTANTARAARPGQAAPSASRIVRIGRRAIPLGTATVVLVTLWAVVPREAWLPVPRGAQPLDLWQWPLERPTLWLTRLHLRAATLVAGDVVGAAIALAGLAAAITTATLTAAFRSTGLGAMAAAVLALVAASAPLFIWQAGSPMGGAALSGLSALALWWGTAPARSDRQARWLAAMRTRLGSRPRRPGPRWVVWSAAVVLGALVLWRSGGTTATLERVRLDLGPLGLLLLFIALGTSRGATRPTRRVAGVTAALFVLAAPLPSHLRAALCLPWAWWLVGDGLVRVVAWRERATQRWVVLGLAAWVALHAGRVPWGQQRQQAALVRTWAEGVADIATHDRPVATTATATGVLIDALVSSRGDAATRVLLPVSEARAAARTGRRPVVTDRASREALQWGGLALDDLDGGAGIALDRVLDALPRGTIVLAAVSRDAAATLTPGHWQALGRVGLRLADAGAFRTHAVAGVTRARVEALEVAQAGSARLDLQPGDPLGRTGARAPVDARLEADDTRVRIFLRDRPLLDEAGLALLFFTTRGDLLGWRSGTDGAHLDGPPLGGGALVRHVAVASLPCLELEPGRHTDLHPVLGTGTLGFTPVRVPTLVALVSRNPSAALTPVLLPRDDGPTASEVTHVGGASRAQFRLTAATPTGLSLRHDDGLSALVDAPVRVCAAAPLPRAFDVDEGPIDIALLPRHEPLHGAGWHALEGAAGGGYFRWMDGPRATLLLPLRSARDLRLVLDAQGVRRPLAGDLVRLSINGQPVGERPLHTTRGIYEWDVPAAALEAGVNIVRLETTATLRPADLTPGADPRRLGLLVYGWRVLPRAVH